MPLEQIEIANVRNIGAARLRFSPSINLMVGENASGKTTLLEAIHLLGYGRSFRPGPTRQIVAHGQEALTVAGAVRDASGLRHRLGIRLSAGDKEIRVDERKAESQAELSRLFPVIAVQPSAQILLESAPELRRQFLDWTVFQADEGFLEQWRRYHKSLEQRNRLLRQRVTGSLDAWDHEIALYGERVGAARAAVLERLAVHVQEVSRPFLRLPELRMDYRQGWRAGVGLQEACRTNLERDLSLGYTADGPHRADFVITVNGQPVRHFLSRGQMKLLVIALKLAQARLAHQARGECVTLLLDDLASELDENNRAALFEALLANEGIQIVLTATDLAVLQGLHTSSSALFRLDKGIVTPNQATP
jgi:DNA replication and repair protein RecF